MSSFILALNAIVPVFILIMLGLLVRRVRIVDEHTVAYLSKLLFRVLMPTLLFMNIYNTSIKGSFNFRVVLFCIVSITAIWIIVGVISLKVFRSNRVKGAFTQVVCRSNIILYGISIIGFIAPAGMNGTASVVAAVVVPTINFYAVTTLEIFRQSQVKITKLAFEILKNPLIIASIIGFIVIGIGLHLPGPLEAALFSVGKMTSALGLLTMGAALTFIESESNRSVVVVAVFLKLLIIPLIMISLAILIGFRGMDLLTIIVVFASPTAITSYPMAVEMESDANLTCQVVVITTLLACLVTFGCIFICGYFSLI